MLGFLAKLLVNEKLIRHVLSATVNAADDVRRRSRDVDSARSKAAVGDMAARVSALEAALLKESGMTSMLAAQLEGTAAALQAITFRVSIALALGALAVILALAALLVAVLR
jgi:hypothetical protein